MIPKVIVLIARVRIPDKHDEYGTFIVQVGALVQCFKPIIFGCHFLVRYHLTILLEIIQLNAHSTRSLFVTAQENSFEFTFEFAFEFEFKFKFKLRLPLSGYYRVLLTTNHRPVSRALVGDVSSNCLAVQRGTDSCC